MSLHACLPSPRLFGVMAYREARASRIIAAWLAWHGAHSAIARAHKHHRRGIDIRAWR